jgi:hypothetical protein
MASDGRTLVRLLAMVEVARHEQSLPAAPLLPHRGITLIRTLILRISPGSTLRPTDQPLQNSRDIPEHWGISARCS